jgi:hypothetical protein
MSTANDGGASGALVRYKTMNSTPFAAPTNTPRFLPSASHPHHHLPYTTFIMSSRMNWNNELDGLLMQHMRREKDTGHRAQSGWKTQTWNRGSAFFASLGYMITWKQVRDRFTAVCLLLLCSWFHSSSTLVAEEDLPHHPVPPPPIRLWLGQHHQPGDGD